MVVESNQNVFLIQKDASSFAEFEISEFEISRVDCSLTRIHDWESSNQGRYLVSSPHMNLQSEAFYHLFKIFKFFKCIPPLQKKISLRISKQRLAWIQIKDHIFIEHLFWIQNECTQTSVMHSTTHIASYHK